MSSGEGHGCCKEPPFADRVERRKQNVGTDQEVDVFFCVSLYPLNQNGRSEARDLESLPCLCQRRRRSISLPPIFTSRSRMEMKRGRVATSSCAARTTRAV